MTTFLNLGKRIVNIDQIVSIKRLEAEPAREECDRYSGDMLSISAKPFGVEITLTAVEADVREFDFSQFHVTAASSSQTITLRGERAEKVWRYFEARAGAAAHIESADRAPVQVGVS